MEAEPNEDINLLPNIKLSPKTLASLRKNRQNLWAKREELRRAKASEKASTLMLLFFLSLVVIYFGLGVYHGLKN